MSTPSLEAIPRLKKDVLVVGSGAAGYGAAVSLCQEGVRDLAVVTESRLSGTSRNTGSDKQTYYKLTLSGAEPDSVRQMAQSLYRGQLVDGDHALTEAALSVRAFYRLVHYGVPFPHTAYGEYVGYKTDHDPLERATSVGPYTSRAMTEALERAVIVQEIPILDRLLVVKILTREAPDSGQPEFAGLLCLDLTKLEEPDVARRFVILEGEACVWATGGPACLYRDSVFPGSQHGSSGVAFEAGARGKNLTEWQYGLASVKPRWNVSGSYMQVLPRFISVDEAGVEREFLGEALDDFSELLGLVFLKGYQWPFDVTKAHTGSSQIDLLVHEQTRLGRRVFLDFRQNPGQLPELDYDALPPEARDYMRNTGICFGTPVERLSHLNAPALDFYREHGTDLRTEPLEIALCAQHNNGGLEIDGEWMTDVSGLYAVGEVAASHGVYRPGGSALNAGQTGGLRAAMAIAQRLSRQDQPAETSLPEDAILGVLEEAEAILRRAGDPAARDFEPLRRDFAGRMSEVAGALRQPEGMARLHADVSEALHYDYKVQSPQLLPAYFRYRDLLRTLYVYLAAFLDYVETGGSSRGSALYEGDPKALTCDPEAIQLVDREGRVTRRPVRPLPPEAPSFETVWREDRARRSRLTDTDNTDSADSSERKATP